jgi:hypothetical protein
MRSLKMRQENKKIIERFLLWKFEPIYKYNKPPETRYRKRYDRTVNKNVNVQIKETIRTSKALSDSPNFSKKDCILIAPDFHRGFLLFYRGL